MQVEVKHSYYQSFGGINFMQADFDRLGFHQLITKHLGNRSCNAAYSYADVLKSLFFMFSIGGDVLDDFNTLRKQMQDHPALKICSPDTVEYVCKELQQSTTLINGSAGVIHHINEHSDFNKLLPALGLKGGAFTTQQSHTLDYDGHIIENTKADRSFTYKQTQGYYPVVLSINKLPVYLQNRKGNTPENFNQLQLIKKTVGQCRELNLQINKFRADASCYEKNTIEWLEENEFTYYIRAELNEALRIALQDETEWQPLLLNNRKIEVCSIKEKLFSARRRIVAYREKVSGQLNLGDIDGYRYYSIVTNDEEMNAQCCLEFYNQRGCQGEHHFKELDYDFGWNKLPFDNFEMNTIYLYATTIAYLLFNIFKIRYAAKTSLVKTSMRLKNFILHFVTLTAKWIKTARRYILKIFTLKDYSPVFET